MERGPVSLTLSRFLFYKSRFLYNCLLYTNRGEEIMPDPNQQGPMSWADLLNQFGGGAGGSQRTQCRRSSRGRRIRYAANPFLLK